MKDRLLQLLLKGHTVQDAIAFWELFRRGRFHALLLEPTANTVTQLFRYVITGVSSFLVDFLLLFFLEAAGMHYLPAAACSFTAGTVCNFLLTKFSPSSRSTPRWGRRWRCWCSAPSLWWGCC